jgi:hypothetical protein
VASNENPNRSPRRPPRNSKKPVAVPANSKTPRKPASRKRRPPPTAFWSKKNLALLGVEYAGLAITGLLGTMLALGSSASWFSGSSFFANLLPFATGIAAWVIFSAGLFLIWLKARPWLKSKAAPLPAALTLCMAAALAWFALHDGYTLAFTHFRTLVGGKQQAARVTLAHQVYAAYRRHSQPQLEKLILRAEAYAPSIAQAAKAFAVDEDLLFGIASAETSFNPRSSRDGGQGLFQITAVPKHIMQQASGRLKVTSPDLSNPRDNAFIAAATIKHYLSEMNGDLFLGLLAYNIGPRNGGLRFIMRQYGATDFVTLQPYLQQLPRDYPIRALSYALAFRIWRQHGKLLAYQANNNAATIQLIGIPGLENDY